MRPVKTLDLKVLRDVVHWKGQLTAVALLVACGVAMFVSLRGMHGYLRDRQAAYYAADRFGDVFAQVKRAPETLRPRLQAIRGVGALDLRIVQDVLLDVPGLAEPATGRIVSIPEAQRPTLNDVHLRRGRWPEPGRRDEVIVSDAFAAANGLEPGATVGAILNGRWQRLRIVGTAISPEFIYEIRGLGEIYPDNRRFGAMWMRRRALAAAFDMEAAFNDVVVRLSPGASEVEVIAGLDRVLDRYGALGAYGRDDHLSHVFVSSEIAETRVTSVLLSGIFLAVTAFLLHTLLLRLVGMEREQIGTLKAFGFASRTIGLHYLKLALIPVVLGAAVGAALGVWLAVELAEIYARFFQFPEAAYRPEPILAAIGILIAGGAAVVGALAAVRRAVAIPPAVAMRPQAPARYRKGILERTPLWRRIGPAARIIVRNLARARTKAAVSVAGIALALGLVVAVLSLFDSVDYLEDVQFRHASRENVAIFFDGPRPARARYEVAHLPGVWRVESFRSVPARLRREHREARVAILGLEPASELRRIVDADLRVHAPPGPGLLVGRILADQLGVEPDDTLLVEVMEGKRPLVRVHVVDVVDDLVGTSAYTRIESVNEWMAEGPTISGVWVAVDAAVDSLMYARLKRLPRVGGVLIREAALASFEKTIAESFRISLLTTVFFACAVAVGIVYNSARIALSERGRELASLRVLGFSKREVTTMLLGEQALLTLAAIPPGLAFAYGLCLLIVFRVAQTELFRMPLVVAPRTYVLGIAVILVASIFSAWLVRRRVHRLDLIAVLKTRE